ncbi:ATP-binding cassette domain-containing protein [Desulfocurvibacter africanus]|uniref:Molybdate-transporting ATPase n=1 Tax=Desulfocurvibacter africanus subsp. africanus str. Walvis Bay TaxID=690850 RepID=F3Z236_DESAF|nr:ATP-binding cassette domain-containing protein [Desulfocurvibacter africanus]EGJ51245.1 Molybdate-transporting ATPase [Desulfocurvibacter africanus subsp. africanus str. Walvis Bay]
MALSVSARKQLPAFELKISFSVPAGNVLAVIGPSGSGKSTLLRIIAGLDAPDRGYIALKGAPLVDTQAKLILPPQRRHIALVFQDHGLFPHMTLKENVLYAAKDKHMAIALLERFGIVSLRGNLPAQLSGGERQRGAICQALAMKPAALLLDEPFSALDLENRLTLRREVVDLTKAMGIPVVHVTHDLHEALDVGDTLLALRMGRSDEQWKQRQLTLLAEELKPREGGILPAPAMAERLAAS